MSKYIEIPMPITVTPTISAKSYARGDCRIMVTREVYPDSRLRWHLSISCRDRNPTWEEIRDARYALLPDELDMAMILPPKREYVNLHQHCFHLHEIERR